jgi:hypothetical protein
MPSAEEIIKGINNSLTNIVNLSGMLKAEQVNTYMKTLPSNNLEDWQVENTKVFSTREKLIESFPVGGKIAEIGVDRGDFSKHILSVSQPRELYLIDYWQFPKNAEAGNEDAYNNVKTRFAKEIVAKQVILVKGMSTDVLINYPDGFFDWVYIDSAHDYKTTVAELEICRNKVKPNGIIAGHDYCAGNVAKTFYYGITNAVNDFCLRYKWRMQAISIDTGAHWSFAIIKE